VTDEAPTPRDVFFLAVCYLTGRGWYRDGDDTGIWRNDDESLTGGCRLLRADGRYEDCWGDCGERGVYCCDGLWDAADDHAVLAEDDHYPGAVTEAPE
jgi:hypothetical protein